MADQPPDELAQRRAKATPQYCFTCPCGHQTFVLRPDARIECGHCAEIQERLLWGQYFTSPPGLIDSTPIKLTDDS
jgi:hypothetical protein